MAVNIPPPKTTSSGYVIGSQDPLSPHYTGPSYFGKNGPNTQSFTPSPRADGLVLDSGYTVGTQMPDSQYYQGQRYSTQQGAGRYLADEFKAELANRGYYSQNPQNRGAYQPVAEPLRNNQSPRGQLRNALDGHELRNPLRGGQGNTPGSPINSGRNPTFANNAKGSAAAGVIVGAGAAYQVASSGGGFFEATWTGLGNVAGWGIGGALGAAGGAAAGAGLGTVTFPGVGTISGAGVGGYVGAGVGGYAGGKLGQTIAQPIGKAIDDAIPDIKIPKPPLIPESWWPFDDDKYPNQTPADAMGQGPKTDEGAPAVPGEVGGVAGAVYQLRWTTEAYPTYAPQVSVYQFFTGPVATATGIDWYGARYVRWKEFIGANGYSVRATIESTFNDGVTIQIRNGGGSLERTDGGTDPPAQPEVPPTYAPNPARPRVDPDGVTPSIFPPPPTPFIPGYQPGGDTPWPGVAPQTTPDTQPIYPEPDAPPNFSPTPTDSPTPTAPGTPVSPSDLTKPKETPPNLQDDPYTPERTPDLGATNKTDNADGTRTYELPDGTKITEYPDGSKIIDSPTDSPWLDKLHNPTQPLIPPIIPIPLNVGAQQKLDTPSPPDLNKRPVENPNVQRIQQPVQQSKPEGPKGTCFYEFQRVADIQRKATEVNEQAKNPTTGFTGLYGIGIESRLKLGETFTLLQNVNTFMRKAWEMTRMQKVLDVLTFIGVMHNVSMLSRDVGETFFQLITTGVQAVGIRDEEGGVIDVGQVIGKSVESLLRGILTDQVYEGIGEAWNKANRIVSSASAIIWSIRSMGDASLDLLEWVGEHTGRIGNALKRWGVVGERAYPWMSEKPRALPKGRRWLNRATGALEMVEDSLSVYQQGVSSVIEVQEESQETMEAIDRFSASILDAVPDPWADNTPVKNAHDASKAISDGPDVPPSEAQKG